MNLPRRSFIKTMAAGAAVVAVPGVSRAQKRESKKPNIIFILIDDLGKEWVNFCGSEASLTPNADKLAATGMRFTNAYCMPQCTPTRATLMTGQYPWRNGWINHWDVPRWGAGCYFDWKHNQSFARVMQSAGYATVAAGKWQVNDFRVHPDAMQKHGFDDHCMWTGGEGHNYVPSGERYWDPYINTKEGTKTYKGQFSEDIFTDFIIDFFKKNKKKPVMAYYPMCLPHGPNTTTPLEPNAKPGLPQFKAMVRYADHMLGKLVDALDEMKIRDNTIIIWTTDNGTSGGITGRLNGRDVPGGKAKSTENGINVPFVVNCPGLVPEGVVTDTLTDFTDMLPTFAELGGAQLPVDTVIDGKSIARVILGKREDGPRRWIMALGGNPATLTEDNRVRPAFDYRDRVIRNKQYKLFIDTDKKRVALYDLLNDPGEENNLIKSRKPEHLGAIKKLGRVARKFPEKDAWPKYDPAPPQAWDVTYEAIQKHGPPGMYGSVPEDFVWVQPDKK